MRACGGRRVARCGGGRRRSGVLWRWRRCVGVCQIWVDSPLTLPARRRCGWPAFDRCYKGAVRTEVDSSFGMRRVEIMCSSCGGHLGHVFEGERRPATSATRRLGRALPLVSLKASASRRPTRGIASIPFLCASSRRRTRRCPARSRRLWPRAEAQRMSPVA